MWQPEVSVWYLSGLPYFLRQGLSTRLELTNWQKCLASKLLGYSCPHILKLGLQMHILMPNFSIGARDQNPLY